MNTKGIRILDMAPDLKLQSILEEINEGDLYYWSVLDFYGMGHLENEKSLPDFEKKVCESEKGVILNWKDLDVLSRSINQLFSILLIGCKDRRMIRRFENSKKMYDSCDIVIEMIDSSFWEVFSFDLDFIERLSQKFKETEFLKSNFQDEWLKKDNSQ